MTKMSKIRIEGEASTFSHKENAKGKTNSWLEPIGIMAGVSIPAGAALISTGALHYREYAQHLLEGRPDQITSLCMAAVAGALGALGANHRASAKRHEELIVSIQMSISSLADFVHERLDVIEEAEEKSDLHEQQIRSLLGQIELLTAHVASLKQENNRILRDNRKSYSDENWVSFDDHIASFKRPTSLESKED